eukprot:evm.model.scf_393EXC.4 EVM.evm.TU.scf_393EXC.4   scf_393EXC:35319-37775(+)
MLLRLGGVHWAGGDLHLTSLEADGTSSPAIEGYLDFCDLSATPKSSERWGERSSTMPLQRSPLGSEVAKASSAKAVLSPPRAADPTEWPRPPGSSTGGSGTGASAEQSAEWAGKGPLAGVPPVPSGRWSQRGDERRDRARGPGAASITSSEAAMSSSGARGDHLRLIRHGWRGSSGGTTRLLDGALEDPFYDMPGRCARMEEPPVESGDYRMLTGLGSGIRMELVTTDSTHTTVAPYRSVDRSVGVSSAGRPPLASKESFLHYDVEDQQLSLSTVPDSGETSGTSPNLRSDGAGAWEGAEGTLSQRYKSLVSRGDGQGRVGLNLEAVRRAGGAGPAVGELDSARNSRSRRPGSSSLSGESSDAPQGGGKEGSERGVAGVRETRHARALSDPTSIHSPTVAEGQEERNDSAADTAFPAWPMPDGKDKRHSVDEKLETGQSWPVEINSYPPSESRHALPPGPGWQPPMWQQQQQYKAYEAALGLAPVRSIQMNSISVSGPLPEGSVAGMETSLVGKGLGRVGRLRRLFGRLFWCRWPGGKKRATVGEDEEVANSIFYEGVDEGVCKETGLGRSTAGYARRQKFMMRMIEESRLE